MREWLSNLLLRFAARRIGWGDLPPEGQSSVPSWRGLGSGLSAMVNDHVPPPVPFELTEALEQAWIWNPNISQAVKNWTNMANTGHQVVLDGPEARVERALDTLNAAARRVYARSAGIDGLINHLLDQIAITGAVSAEDVVDLAAREISEVVLVPPHTIRYREENGRLVPYQRTSSVSVREQMVPLNEHTWAMYCLQVYRDSPYPKPPMTASLKPLKSERTAWESLEFILQKLGLLGLVIARLAPLSPKPGEDDAAYERRKADFLQKALSAFVPNFRKGLMVGYKDFELEHHNVVGDARGAREIFQIVEEQLFSGIGTSPAMHGRNYTTTETYAGVIYGILVRDGENSQRLVKRRIERTYRLELMLKNLEVDGVSVQFNDAPHLSPLAHAQAESQHVRTVIEKARAGVADPDELAQELGYDSWFDVEKINPSMGGFFLSKRNRRAFRYDKRKNKYVFHRERIALKSKGETGGCLSSPGNAGVSPACCYSPVSTESYDPATDELERALREYLAAMAPYLSRTRAEAVSRALDRLARATVDEFPEASLFAEAVLAEVRAEYLARMASAEAKALSSAEVESLYERFKTGSTTAFDAGAPIAFRIGDWDRRAIGFMREVDGFFFSKFVDNETMKKPLLNFLREEFLEKGEGLLGRSSPETVAAFRDLFADRLASLENHQVRGIIDHSVQRIRNWSSGRQMLEAEIEYAEVVAVIDNRTSKICQYMNGKRIPVGVANRALDKIVQMTPEQYLDHLKAIDPAEYFIGGDLDTIAADGRGFPPYHAGGCRTRLKAIVD